MDVGIPPDERGVHPCPLEPVEEPHHQERSHQFEVVDNKTVQYTWDDPNYALVDRGLGSGLFSNRLRGLYSASHYLKQFHPDYGDKAKVDAAIAEAGVENWVELMKLKVNHYQNVDLPVLNAWKTIDPSEGEEWIQERNPYFYAVDTAGNQLPYIDKIHSVLVEDLETVALRAANGDVSFQGRHMTLAKVPLYRAERRPGQHRDDLLGVPVPQRRGDQHQPELQRRPADRRAAQDEGLQKGACHSV